MEFLKQLYVVRLYFVGKDVAKALGYSNFSDALNKHVDAEDRDAIAIRDSIGRRQKAIFINESGLYSLILSSQLEQAKAFKRLNPYRLLILQKPPIHGCSTP